MVCYKDKDVEITVDNRGNLSGWELIFPAAFNKSSDITYETGND